LALLLDYGAVKWWRLRRLLGEGTVTTGVVVQSRQRPGDRGPDSVYRYQDSTGATYEGTLYTGPGLRLRQDAFTVHEAGGEPAVGQSIAVTYLPLEPSLHTPYALSARCLWTPVRQTAGFAFIAGLVLAAVVAAYVMHLRQTRPQRSRTALDDGGPPEFVIFVRGEFVPADHPALPVAMPGSTSRPEVVGWIEREGWRGHLQLAACAAAYYAVATLAWHGVPRALPSGTELPPAWFLALAFSPLVLLTLVVLLALRLPVRRIGLAVAVVLAVQYLAAFRGTAPGLAHDTVQAWPLRALLAWALPAVALIALERWRRLWVRLGLLVPVVQDGADLRIEPG
jgi:hypothetical protein